jgi:hypothetical protein
MGRRCSFGAVVLSLVSSTIDDLPFVASPEARSRDSIQSENRSRIGQV